MLLPIITHRGLRMSKGNELRPKVALPQDFEGEFPGSKAADAP
jgi:hypothetical protein